MPPLYIEEFRDASQVRDVAQAAALRIQRDRYRRSRPGLHRLDLRSRGIPKTSNRGRGALVVAVFALAVMFLTGADLMIRSFVAVLAVDPGFRSQGILTARFTLRDPNLYPELMNRVRALPGVQAVGPINGIMRPGSNMDPDKTTVGTVTAGDVFQTLRLPLVKGRFFTERDAQPEAPPAAIVNEAFERRFFPGVDPVGRTHPGILPGDPPPTIVGVVKNMPTNGLERRPVAQIFPAPRPRQKFPTELVVRASEPKQIVQGLRDAIRDLDKSAVLWNIGTLEQRLEAQVSQRRFQSYMLGLFAFLALALAGVGIYGPLHYSVAQRTREIGIRMALGARAGDVQRMIVREGLLLVLSGVSIGIAGAFALTRSLASLLFGVTPTDPATFAVGLTLTAIAVCACSVPAWRATRVDPLTALRCE